MTSRPLSAGQDNPYVLRWCCAGCQAHFLSHGQAPAWDLCPTCGTALTLTGEVWDLREGTPRWLQRLPADSQGTP